MARTLFGWNDVSLGMLCVLAIICLFLHYFIFTFLENWDHETQKLIDSIQGSCLTKCESKTCTNLTSYRDKNYYTTGAGDGKKCIFTFWELTHFLFHTFIGYYYNIYTSFVVSGGYEIYEHYQMDCGSLLDIGWNFMGFLVGFGIRNCLN